MDHFPFRRHRPRVQWPRRGNPRPSQNVYSATSPPSTVGMQIHLPDNPSRPVRPPAAPADAILLPTRYPPARAVCPIALAIAPVPPARCRGHSAARLCDNPKGHGAVRAAVAPAASARRRAPSLRARANQAALPKPYCPRRVPCGLTRRAMLRRWSLRRLPRRIRLPRPLSYLRDQRGARERIRGWKWA